jgi:hypothetical protein
LSAGGTEILTKLNKSGANFNDDRYTYACGVKMITIALQEFPLVLMEQV